MTEQKPTPPPLALFHKSIPIIAHACLVSVLMLLLAFSYMDSIPPDRPAEYMQVSGILMFSHVVLFVWLALKLRPIDSLVNETADHLQAINTVIARIDATTTSIAATVNEQSDMTRSLLDHLEAKDTHTMQDLSRTAETTKRMAQDVKTISSELNTQSAQLSDSVTTFFKVIRRN